MPLKFASSPVGTVSAARRIAAIDMLRGWAVVLMIFDTTLYYLDDTPIGPMEIAKIRPTLFFTQWLLLFCPPIFALLAGTGAYLRLAAERSKRTVSGFLATRGLILVVIDLFIVPLLKWFHFDLQRLSTGPLWALGWSMVALGCLIWLRVGTVAVAGLLIVASHNALDGIHAGSLGALSGLWTVLHEPGTVRVGEWLALEVTWPLLPWLGVMACGYGLGELYRIPGDQRRMMLAGVGSNLLLMFLILRSFNFYGDPAGWSRQATLLRSVMSFVNCTAQPPSACYLLMTLGPAVLFLAWFEGRRSWRLDGLAALGCVPLYCYLAHWLMLHALAIGLAVMRGQPTLWLFQVPEKPTGRGFNWQPAFGVELTIAMLLGLAAMVVLYFSARRYAQLKFLRGPRWISYF
ncbi:MAG: DUF1624 domain-containing protein [Pirellulales bacterium]|nr:DUF1624 domain-containing protein [Pirellulales bacterium]